METIATLLRGTTATVAVALILAACGPADQPDPEALCDPVDELIAIAADLGTDPDEITDDYRRLADVSDAVAEMSDTINANLPIGLGADAMDQIEQQCDPDYSDLTPSS